MANEIVPNTRTHGAASGPSDPDMMQEMEYKLLNRVLVADSFVERVQSLIADDFDVYNTHLQDLLAALSKDLDARMEQRICEYVKRSDQTTSSVETRGELCLAYISHLECQVANQKMALKDKETLSEQIQEVKMTCVCIVCNCNCNIYLSQFYLHIFFTQFKTDARERKAELEKELKTVKAELVQAQALAKVVAEELVAEKQDHMITKMLASKQEELDRCELSHLASRKEGLERQAQELQEQLAYETEKRVKSELLAQVLEDALEMNLASNLVTEENYATLEQQCQQLRARLTVLESVPSNTFSRAVSAAAAGQRLTTEERSVLLKQLHETGQSLTTALNETGQSLTTEEQVLLIQQLQHMEQETSEMDEENQELERTIVDSILDKENFENTIKTLAEEITYLKSMLKLLEGENNELKSNIKMLVASAETRRARRVQEEENMMFKSESAELFPESTLEKVHELAAENLKLQSDIGIFKSEKVAVEQELGKLSKKLEAAESVVCEIEDNCNELLRKQKQTMRGERNFKEEAKQNSEKALLADKVNALSSCTAASAAVVAAVAELANKDPHVQNEHIHNIQKETTRVVNGIVAKPELNGRTGTAISDYDLACCNEATPPLSTEFFNEEEREAVKEEAKEEGKEEAESLDRIPSASSDAGSNKKKKKKK